MTVIAHDKVRRKDALPLAVVVVTIVAVAYLLSALVSGTQALLFLTGAGLGLALYHASFGFTGGWKRFATEGRSRSMRAQVVMIGLAACAMIPLTSGLGGLNAIGAWSGLVRDGLYRQPWRDRLAPLVRSG